LEIIWQDGIHHYYSVVLVNDPQISRAANQQRFDREWGSVIHENDAIPKQKSHSVMQPLRIEFSTTRNAKMLEIKPSQPRK
jgi:hypothetical protein